MKKTTFALLFCGLFAAQADFVYQSGLDFLTTADLDGDGRSDLVLVDGANATVRIGYQLSASTITWFASRSLGLDEATGIACGNVLNAGHDVLVATAPMLNRYNLYHLNSPSQPPVPITASAAGIGPRSVVAMDIGGAGNTVNDDLFSISIMNGSSPYKGTRIRSDGTQLITFGSANTLGSAWSRLNEVEYKTGLRALAIIDGTGTLRLYSLTSGSLVQVVYRALGLPTAPNYVGFIPQGSSYAQFLAWEPGQSTLRALAITEPSPGAYALSVVNSYDLGAPIQSIQLVAGAGITRLAVVFDGGVAAAIYDYDGTGAPNLLQEISSALPDRFVGVLPFGTDDLVVLSSSSGDLSGVITANQHTFSGGQFVSTGTEMLPRGRVGAQANVMTFASEPFVNNAPRRLQLLRAGDWASSSIVAGGSVSATVETDAGTLDGLGNPQAVSLGAANPSAAYTLDNQLHAAISTYSFDAARGDELVGIMVSPDPGSYGTSVAVSFSTTPSATVYYRTAATAAWALYSAPFTLFQDATVQYYAVGGTGQTIIREAAYTFTDTPSNLDSDGDGVPDYVELANGLDPVASGLDSDGDGYSDLEELLAGTDPTNAADVPVDHIEQGSVYDLVLTPRPYDGVANATKKSAIDTQVRLFSTSGGLRGFAKTTNLVLGVTTDNPAAHFSALPRSMEPPFLAAVSDPRFDVNGSTLGNQRGGELVGLYSQPAAASIDVGYTYQGGALAIEAANWVALAQDAYGSQIRDIEVDSLGLDETIAGLLAERKMADLLYGRGVVTNAWLSLFKGRSADRDMDGMTSSSLQGLEVAGPGGEPAYHLPTLVAYLQGAVPSLTNLRALTQDIYDTCSDLGRSTNTVGKYPLPVDVLRSFIYTGTLQSNYLAQTSRTAPQMASAFNEAIQALALVASRPVGTFSLEVRTNSFEAACPVLYTGGGTAKSLYVASGNPYRFPITFTLQPGALVSVEAYTDPDWNLCPGTDPLEVIALNLTAVPVASGSDANGNLIPDDYEGLFLVGSGGLATSDLDGDGYSDLQEYLEQSDPANAPDLPGVPVADLSPPIILISTPVPGQAQLDIDWPASYADAFVFTVVQTTNLSTSAFAGSMELPRGALSESMDMSSGNAGFYRVQMRLR
ncbi:MAG: hypothetical protein K9M54_01890 [Kiritimatiellales bacterium]|nr:hypothetical protein [Kiritimatiellales bacterium]